jgi:hypothetical protein
MKRLKSMNADETIVDLNRHVSFKPMKKESHWPSVIIGRCMLLTTTILKSSDGHDSIGKML